MGNKNKTVSFRVKEDSFETLREIAEERDLSLSAVFRDYVDTLVAHDGRVKVVPETEIGEATTGDDEFPPKVEVPKSFLREHERLELEADHLREQLQEYKRYATQLQTQIESNEEAVEDIVQLEDLDEELATDETYRLG